MTPRYVPFALLFSYRSNIVRQRTLTVVTALAVCTAVALATALEMSARSVEAQLETTATALAGAAEVEVTGGALGIPESLLDEIRDVPGVGVVVPYVQTSLRIAEGPDPGTSLYVIGVDLLLDQTVRTYAVNRDEFTVPDPLALLADVRAVLVTRSLAERLGIAPGDPVRVERDGAPTQLVVRGLLEPGGVAEAFGGSVAVMDVYSLQTLLGREGWLDRADVVVAGDANVSDVMERLAERVAGVATVRRAAARDEWVDYTMDTIRTLALSLELVAVLVASLVVFGAMAVAVDRRSLDFALLRTVGLESTRVQRLIRADALAVAAVGTALGLPLGILLSQLFVPVLSRVSEYLQAVRIDEVAPSLSTLAVGLLVGLVIAYAGTQGPARRAARVDPLVVLRGQRAAAETVRLGRAGWLLSGGAAVVWTALATTSFGLPPLVRVALLFGIGIAVPSFAVVRLVPTLLRRGRPLLEIAIPRVGRLAGASLTSRSRSSGLTIAAVAGVLAGVVATLAMVDSLARTLDDWIATEYRDAVLVTAGSPFAGRDRELVRPETTARVSAVDGVRAVSQLFTADILYRGSEILLVGQSMDVLERYGRLPALGSDPAGLARALREGGIAVSDAFADHFGVRQGDSLTLSTPQGQQTFPVVGMFRDYVGPAGSVQLDIDVLDRYWEREGSYMLAVWVDSPPESVVDAIRAAAGDDQPLFFIYGEALDHYAGDVLRNLTGVLNRAAMLTTLLGGLAVANLLLGSVTERRRELFLLRSVGASDGQLTALVFVDAVLIALLGALVGVGVGLVCAYPIVTDVLREAFGWSVVFQPRPASLALVLAGVVVAAVLAALYPARLVRRLLPREVYAPE